MGKSPDPLDSDSTFMAQRTRQRALLWGWYWWSLWESNPRALLHWRGLASNFAAFGQIRGIPGGGAESFAIDAGLRRYNNSHEIEFDPDKRAWTMTLMRRPN